MTATQRALALSVFVICISFAMTIMDEVNADYEAETGRKFKEVDVTPFNNYSDFEEIGSELGDINNTINSATDFKKPSDVGFDFGFFQSLNMMRILANVIIYSTVGFPLMLVNFGMPVMLTFPMIILINLSHLLMIVYIILGKSF